MNWKKEEKEKKKEKLIVKLHVQIFNLFVIHKQFQFKINQSSGNLIETCNC